MPEMMRLANAGFVALALVACSGSTEPLDDGEWAETLRAKARWNAAGISNYTIEQRRLCFCPPGEGDWARVTVRDGRVVSALRIDDAQPINTGGRLTVPQMFEVLENNRRVDYVEDIAVRFDSRYGYPTLIELSHGPNVTDGGLTIQARGLAVLP